MKCKVYAILCTLLFCSIAHATPIDIISESHHIEGAVGVWNPETTQTYDITNSDPIFNRLDGTGIDYWGPEPSVSEAYTGDFTAQTFAVRWQAHALAESTYIFAPNTDCIDFEFSGSGDFDYPNEALVKFSLIDLTENLMLIDEDFGYSYSVGDDLSFNNLYSLDFDLSHTYSLNLFTYSFGGDFMRGSQVSCNIYSSATPTPEPTTSMLLVTGIIGLAGTSFRKLKK